MRPYEIQNDRTLALIKISTKEVRDGLNCLFALRLERFGAHIRTQKLSPIEACELLEQEAEKIRNEHYEASE